MTTFDVDAIRARFPALALAHDGRPMVFFDGPGGTQVPESVIEAVVAATTASRTRTTAAHFADLRALRRDRRGRPRGDRRPARRRRRRDHARPEHDDAHVPHLALDRGDPAAGRRDRRDRRSTTRRTSIRGSRRRATARRSSAPGSRTSRTARSGSKTSTRCSTTARGSSRSAGHRTPWARSTRSARSRSRVARVGCVAVRRRGPRRAAPAARRARPSTRTSWPARSTSSSARTSARSTGGARSLDAPAGVQGPAGRRTGSRRGRGNFEGYAGAARRGRVPRRPRARATAARPEGSSRRETGRSPGCARFAPTSWTCTATSRRASTRSTGSRILGLTADEDMERRTPTAAITIDGVRPRAAAERLGERGIAVWDGDFYATGLIERLGLAPDGVVRIGLTHYNTRAEVDRLADELATIAGRALGSPGAHRQRDRADRVSTCRPASRAVTDDAPVRRPEHDRAASGGAAQGARARVRAGLRRSRPRLPPPVSTSTSRSASTRRSRTCSPRSGTTVHLLDAEVDSPDLLYAFDPLLITDRGAIPLRPGKPNRRIEPRGDRGLDPRQRHPDDRADRGAGHGRGRRHDLAAARPVHHRPDAADEPGRRGPARGAGRRRRPGLRRAVPPRVDADLRAPHVADPPDRRRHRRRRACRSCRWGCGSCCGTWATG